MLESFIAKPSTNPFTNSDKKLDVNRARARLLISRLELEMISYLKQKGSMGECIKPHEITAIFYSAKKEMENL